MCHFTGFLWDTWPGITRHPRYRHRLQTPPNDVELAFIQVITGGSLPIHVIKSRRDKGKKIDTWHRIFSKNICPSWLETVLVPLIVRITLSTNTLQAPPTWPITILATPETITATSRLYAFIACSLEGRFATTLHGL